MTRVAILLCALTLSSFCHADENPLAKADAKTKPNMQDFDFEIEVTGNDVTYPLTISRADADLTVKCFVRIVNGSKAPLTFNTVSASCTCTDIKVPSQTIEPGAMTYAELTFPAIRMAENTEIGAAINTSGDISKIYLSIRGELSNVAKFKNNVATLEFDAESVQGDNSIVVYSIPVVVSDDLLPSYLFLKHDPKLPIVRHSFVTNDGKLLLNVSVDTSEVDPNGVSGEIELFRKNVGKGVSIPCHIRRGSRVTITPTSLSFASDKSATSFLRIKPAPNKKPSDEITLNSIQDSTNRFSVEPKRLSNGVYRLTVTQKDSTSELDISKNIVISIDSSEGTFDRHLSISGW